MRRWTRSVSARGPRVASAWICAAAPRSMRARNFRATTALERRRPVVALLKDGAAVEAVARRRARRGGARSHAVLRRVRRPGRRCGRARRAGQFASSSRTRRSVARRIRISGGWPMAAISSATALAAHVDGARRRRDRSESYRPRICCTRRCARCWARTCSRKARWWRPIGCASTSRTSSRVEPEELHDIERLVNAQIRRNEPAETGVMEYEQAVASGAMALFGEKYDKDVRVLRIGDFSMELCGGTHVERAGDIGLLQDHRRKRCRIGRAAHRGDHRRAAPSTTWSSTRR